MTDFLSLDFLLEEVFPYHAAKTATEQYSESSLYVVDAFPENATENETT